MKFNENKLKKNFIIPYHVCALQKHRAGLLDSQDPFYWNRSIIIGFLVGENTFYFLNSSKIGINIKIGTFGLWVLMRYNITSNIRIAVWVNINWRTALHYFITYVVNLIFRRFIIRIFCRRFRRLKRSSKSVNSHIRLKFKKHVRNIVLFIIFTKEIIPIYNEGCH